MLHVHQLIANFGRMLSGACQIVYSWFIRDFSAKQLEIRLMKENQNSQTVGLKTKRKIEIKIEPRGAAEM